VHDDSFPNNNIYKSNIPKPDPTKVKKLAFNVIKSLQEKVHSLESVLHGLRDKIDEDFEKFDEKYSDRYEQLNRKLGITEKRLENLGKNFLTLYNKFLRVEKMVDEEIVEVGSDKDIDDNDEDNDGIDDEEEEPILQPLLNKLNHQFKF
jgi:predicted  nucleic acid-binding Zn-ribbon protein